jgi:hypothetical protein
MRHIKTIESFLNEGKDFGDMTSAIGGGNNTEFSQFFNSVKKGDTFMYAPNGVELDYIDKADMNKKEIELSTSMLGRDANPKKCIVELVKKGAILLGGSFEFEGDQQYAIL